MILTFGVFSTDEVEDAFFDTTNVLHKMAEKAQANVIKYQAKTRAMFTSIAQTHNDRLKELIKDSNDLAVGIAQVTGLLGKNMTEQQKKVIAMLTAANDAAAQGARSAAMEAEEKVAQITLDGDGNPVGVAPVGGV